MHRYTKEMNRYAWILTSFCLAKARAWIETKEMGTGQWFKQEQLIPVQGVDSKKGQLIYLICKGSFQVILYKMIRSLSGKLKKHTKLAKIVKISIFVNRLVFPMNFNRFRHPMTVVHRENRPFHPAGTSKDLGQMRFIKRFWNSPFNIGVYGKYHLFCFTQESYLSKDLGGIYIWKNL